MHGCICGRQAFVALRRNSNPLASAIARQKGPMVTNLATTAVLIFYLALAWLVGPLIGLSGTRLWVLRGGLSLIGIIAAATFVWFSKRLKQDAMMRGPNAAYFLEIQKLLGEAEGKLKVSNTAGIAKLPLVYVLGESNTAKTTTIQHGGLHPELLAGEPERDNQIAPTPTINVWGAQEAVFIETGGKVSTDSQLWKYLLQRTQAAALFSSGQPPRALVVCCDCERLKTKDSAIATGRRLSERLRDVEETLGSSLPGYVGFTKLGQGPHFAEVARALSQEKSPQVLCVTLAREKVGEALFVGDEEAIVAKAFDQLTLSLADKRLEFLRRELHPEKLPSLYEFPREIRKLRVAVAHFLVELTRPVNPTVACFLRGFYFSGVRAVLISETVSPPKVSAAAASVAAATRMFNMEEISALPKPSLGPVVQARKIPEWSFASRLFSEVILRDESALNISRGSRARGHVQATVLSGVAVIFLLLAGLFLFSYVESRRMQRDVLSSARALAESPELTAGQLASTAQLQQLDRLRAALSSIESSQQNRSLYQRLGLGTGQQLHDDVRQIYFGNFRKLLLRPVQRSLEDHLRQLPS